MIPALGVLVSGDAFGYKAVPPLDASNGASGVEYPKTIARVLEALPEVRTVITGHYPTTLTREDLATHGDFLRDFVEAVQAAKRGGRTIDEFVRDWKIPTGSPRRATSPSRTSARCAPTSRSSGTKRRDIPARTRRHSP